jgi:hypothetical protein
LRVTVKVHQIVRDLNSTLLSDGMVEHVSAIKDGLITNIEIQAP